MANPPTAEDHKTIYSVSRPCLTYTAAEAYSESLQQVLVNTMHSTGGV